MTRHKLLAGAGLLALSSYASADGMNAGTVHFTGEIIEPSCIIQGNDGNDNNVPLGTYPTSLFEEVGSQSDDIPFTITLAECPIQTTGLTSVQLTFEGATVPTSNADLLAVSAISTTGAQAATNIGVAVSTLARPDTLLKMDGSTEQIAIPLPTAVGDNVNAQFIARYQATALPVTAGPADANMTINILYK